MTCFKPTVVPTRALLAGALLAGGLLALSAAASAQTAPTGQFGQRTSNGAYVPSTYDRNCVGIICSSLPSVSPGGGPASSPADVAPPPPCQGLICGLTPYGMQRPYTAAEAAQAERQRAAAQAQAAQQAVPMAPTKRARKARRAKVAKVARTPAPAEPEVAR